MTSSSAGRTESSARAQKTGQVSFSTVRIGSRALARVLKGLPAQVELVEAVEITRSLPHGHVAAVLGTARRLGIEELIDPAPSRKRDLVLAMLIAQVIT